MRSALIQAIIWIILVCIIAIAINRILGLELWVSCAIASLAMIVNGLIAEWEDRDNH